MKSLSVGAIELRKVLAGGPSLAEVARAVSARRGEAITRQLVSGWATGSRKPGAELADILYELYRVTPRSWDMVPPPDTPIPDLSGKRLGRPRTDDVVTKTPTLPPPAAPLPPVPRGEVDWAAPGAAAIALETECVRLGEDLQRARATDASQTVINATSKAYQAACDKLAKLKRELAPVEEAKLSQTATFRAMVVRIADALDPYPEARTAVIKAIG